MTGKNLITAFDYELISNPKLNQGKYGSGHEGWYGQSRNDDVLPARDRRRLRESEVSETN